MYVPMHSNVEARLPNKNRTQLIPMYMYSHCNYLVLAPFGPKTYINLPLQNQTYFRRPTILGRHRDDQIGRIRL
jgi:hypothetical protein